MECGLLLRHGLPGESRQFLLLPANFKTHPPRLEI